MIHGNIKSLKASVLHDLEELYNVEVGKDEFLPEQLVLKLADLTSRINKEIAVYINRKGSVLDIIVGDHSTVNLPEINERRGQNLLCGVRCIHTHPSGDSKLSDLDLTALITLKLDGIIAIGVSDDRYITIMAAIPAIGNNFTIENADLFGPFKLGEKDFSIVFRLIKEIDTTLRSNLFHHTQETQQETAILVGTEIISHLSANTPASSLASLDELEQLALTAEAKILKKVLQKRFSPDPAYLIGKGKAEELSLLRQSLNANLVIFDEELSGSQLKNLEEIIGTKVIDRTTLILDIFARRAKSREGKIQVELAQLKYMLPRLIGAGTQLSRLGGGIGTRGPGEKKLETDKRHIRTSIKTLTEELEEVHARRDLQRKSRRKTLTVALVGYTNAGKSTLLNTLCNSNVFAENKLFATLDPTARRLGLPNGQQIVAIDTVGFIRKLPHDLVKAFKSTLEEAAYADIIIHVVDSTSHEMDTHISVVNNILNDIGALNKPTIMVFNKIDLKADHQPLPNLPQIDHCVKISALQGIGIDDLLSNITRLLFSNSFEAMFLIPYKDSHLVSYLYENAKIIKKEFAGEGTKITAHITKAIYDKLKKYFVPYI